MTDMMVQPCRLLSPVTMPAGLQCVQVFLTYDCNMRCTHCTNNLVARKPAQPNLTGRDWIDGLTRLQPAVPVTLRGGEPSRHPDFIEIVEGLAPVVPLRIVTNLTFDVTRLFDRVDPARLNDQPTWAPIRATFHLGHTDPDRMLENVLALEKAGYRVGVLGMAEPDDLPRLREIQRRFLSWGVDFRLRSFVGWINGQLVGDFRYPDAVGAPDARTAACRNSELSIAPDGTLYHCRRDCFARASVAGHLLDRELRITARHSPCRNYGHCHPCDVELRPTVFRGSRHTAMEILPLD